MNNIIINCINRTYCKKLIILLPGQKHPSHFHPRKEETFQVLSGLLDVYIDGRLTRTCVIPGPPVSGINSDLYISHSSKTNNPGFAGRISDLTIFKYAINPQQAFSIYRKGSSMTGITSAFTRYQLQLALLQDNKVKSSYTI